jgi:hypothetical protein
LHWDLSAIAVEQLGWSGLLKDLIMLQRLFTAAQPERSTAKLLLLVLS